MKKSEKIGIAIHAGAGPDSEYVRANQSAYKEGLTGALNAGYALLGKGGSAVDAVEESVRVMEDNPIFNAGRGSALNNKGEVQMYASIMDGKSLHAGAACLLKRVKNPVCFVRAILKEERAVFLGGPEAEEYASSLGVPLEVPAYFVTDLQVRNFMEKRRELSAREMSFNPAIRGTVGAVALDAEGNLAAATSTGGTIYSQPGRIGDTSMIGIGTYANNKVCAVSCTGEGEALIRNVLAHAVYSLKEYSQLPMQEVCNTLIRKKLSGVKEDLGVISIDKDGHIGICFNSERMHRAWKGPEQAFEVHIYKD